MATLLTEPHRTGPYQTAEANGLENGQLPHARRLAHELSRLFKLLADETRLRILFTLSEVGELHVRALCERLEQGQSAVSHHLALLLADGLVERRRHGKHNFYRVVPQRFNETLATLLQESGTGEAARLRVGDYVLSRDGGHQERTVH